MYFVLTLMNNLDRYVEEWFNASSVGLADDEFNIIERELFRGFDKLTEEIDRIFDDDEMESRFSESSAKVRTEIVREEVDVILYSYYPVTLRPNKKPTVRKIRRNIRPTSIQKHDHLTSNHYNPPDEDSTTESPVPLSRIETERRDSLEDVIATDRNVKVLLQLPSNNRKENIKVIAHNDNSVRISYLSSEGKRCRRTLVIPYNLDIDTGRSTYRNGILEITFNKT